MTHAKAQLDALLPQLKLPRYRTRQLAQLIEEALAEARRETAAELTPENTKAACKAAGEYLYVEGYAAGIRDSVDILSDLAQRKIHHANVLESKCRRVLLAVPAFESARFVLAGKGSGEVQIRTAGLHLHAIHLPALPEEDPTTTATDPDAR